MAKTRYRQTAEVCWNCRWFNDSPNYPSTCLLFVKPVVPDHHCYSWTSLSHTWEVPHAGV